MGGFIVCMLTDKQCTYFCLYFPEEPLVLLMEYFRRFSHKPCCFDDTHGFISKLLTDEDIDKVGVASDIIRGVYYGSLPSLATN